MDKKPLSRTAKYYKRAPLSKRHGGNIDIFELIAKYRDYACLWDYNCEDYKNSRLKQRSWMRIAKYFNTDVSMVKTKLKHLRSAYVTEKKKVDKSVISGDSLYRPNLFYYYYLTFLDDIVVTRKCSEKTNDFEYDNTDISQDIEEEGETENFTKTECMEPVEEYSQIDSKSAQHEGVIDVCELISKYKDNKCLWNYNCEDYKNTTLKQKAWENIASYFGFEVSEIRTKIKHLRSSYVSERKKVEQSKLKGITRTPVLFYYKNFSFLDNYVVCRKVPEISRTVDQSKDYKRTSASEFDSDEKDEYENFIKKERYSPETLRAAKRQSGPIDVFKLISKYKEYEFLWNIRNKDYKNLKLKERAWKSIARHFDTGVSVVKTKVKNLRSAYLMEKKKVDKSKILGERPYSPILFYYKKLSFLDGVMVLRKGTDKLVSSRTNYTDKTLDFESTNDYESNNDFEETNVLEFENIEINQDCEEKHEIEQFTKREDIELELPKIQEYSIDISPVASLKRSSEIPSPKILSTRSCISHQPKKRKSQRELKLHKAVKDVERIDVYNSFGKTIALQLKQLSLDVASITMLEVHSILTKKVLEHFKSSQIGDHNQSTDCSEEECVDGILSSVNYENIQKNEFV